METLQKFNEETKRSYTGYLIGGLIGIVAIGVGVWLLTLQPSMEEQKSAVLDGSYREGSPEFEELTKDIIISTHRDTVESPNAFGAISMFIKGNVRNKSEKTFNGLEINVAVVDEFEEVVKEKRVLAIPTQAPRLEPDTTIPITLSIDGFKRSDDRANIRWRVTAIRVAN
ncbi:MAG TPA: hypothetical protein PKD24_15945 [Pyrinomonadaceae bacterium]|nr:hypothetical protein [Pyrinomonadaceae bacterium]HMP66823.1 hypothetical protein [Pyrinomonadaceae bacterium]